MIISKLSAIPFSPRALQDLEYSIYIELCDIPDTTVNMPDEFTEPIICERGAKRGLKNYFFVVNATPVFDVANEYLTTN